MYLEVRALDVNAYDPVGTGEPALRFIEALLILCLLTDSPGMTPDESRDIGENHLQVARHGRDPALKLRRGGREIGLRDWARYVLGSMTGICELLDGDDPSRPYSENLAAQGAAVGDADRTPSARVLRDMLEHGESFFRFGQRLSAVRRRAFLDAPASTEVEARFSALAKSSLDEQTAIEAADRLSFEDYLRRYFSQS